MGKGVDMLAEIGVVRRYRQIGVFCCLLFLDRCAAEFSAGAIEMAYFFFFRKITMLAPSPIRATALTTSTTVQVWMLLSSPVGALEVLSWR